MKCDQISTENSCSDGRLNKSPFKCPSTASFAEGPTALTPGPAPLPALGFWGEALVPASRLYQVSSLPSCLFMALGLNAFCAGWELWGCGKERKKEFGCFISLCRHAPLWCRKEQQNSDHHIESSPCPRTPLPTAQDPVSHYQASHLSSLGTSLSPESGVCTAP